MKYILQCVTLKKKLKKYESMFDSAKPYYTLEKSYDNIFDAIDAARIYCHDNGVNVMVSKKDGENLIPVSLTEPQKKGVI